MSSRVIYTIIPEISEPSELYKAVIDTMEEPFSLGGGQLVLVHNHVGINKDEKTIPKYLDMCEEFGILPFSKSQIDWNQQKGFMATNLEIGRRVPEGLEYEVMQQMLTQGGIPHEIVIPALGYDIDDLRQLIGGYLVNYKIRGGTVHLQISSTTGKIDTSTEIYLGTMIKGKGVLSFEREGMQIKKSDKFETQHNKALEDWVRTLKKAYL